MAHVFNRLTIEDELLQNAYNDYIDLKVALQDEALVGPDDLTSVVVRYLNLTGKANYISGSHLSDSCIRMDVEHGALTEPWTVCVNTAVTKFEGEDKQSKEDIAASDEEAEQDCSVKCLRENLANRVQPLAGIKLKISGPENSARDKELFSSEDTTEVVAILGAAPSVNIKKEATAEGDLSLMLGDKGRFGGRTKINTVTEHKIQHLLNNVVPCRMIKSCEPTEMETVPLKCIVAAEDIDKFKEYAEAENLKCFHVEPVEAERKYKEKDRRLSCRLSGTGAWKANQLERSDESMAEMYRILVAEQGSGVKVNAELCRSVVDSGLVLMPYGGMYQLTPAQAVVRMFPSTENENMNCIMLSWSCIPRIASQSSYHAAYLSIVESVSKLIATGSGLSDIYVKLRTKCDGGRAAKADRTVSALLGAFEAQLRLGIAADIEIDDFENSPINGGKGKKIPVVAAFAYTYSKPENIITQEFKDKGHHVVFLKPYCELNNKSVGTGLPSPDSLLSLWGKANELIRSGKAVAAYTMGEGGIAEALLKMSLGNNIGINLATKAISVDEMFRYAYGGIILELNDKQLAEDIEYDDDEFSLIDLGITNSNGVICRDGEGVVARELIGFENLGESDDSDVGEPDWNLGELVKPIRYNAKGWESTYYRASKPNVVIPVFPGTTGEQDIAKAVREIGAEPEIILIRNYSRSVEEKSIAEFAEALETAHCLFIPGGNYGGTAADIPNDYAVKFMRKPAIKAAITELINHRRGLICGIAEGFGILLKTGLLPYGRYIERYDNESLLDMFAIEGDRFACKVVNTKIASNASPWLRYYETGEEEAMPVIGQEYRLDGDRNVLRMLAKKGQVVSQFVDPNGNTTMDPRYNPGVTPLAIEGLMSPNGRIIGRLGHFERVGSNMNRNVPGNYGNRMFENMMKYFAK